MGCTMGKTAAVPTKKSDITSNGYHGNRQVSFSQPEKPIQNGNVSANRKASHSDSDSDSNSESSNHKTGEKLSYRICRFIFSMCRSYTLPNLSPLKLEFQVE